MVPVKGSINRANGCACGMRCDLERPAADVGIVVDEVLATMGAQLPDHMDMRGSVNAQQVIDRSSTGFAHLHIGRHPLHHITEPPF
jgi:hypothetical protein